jgi:hypothetical protein
MVAHQVTSMAAATRIQKVCACQGIDVHGITIQCAVSNLQRKDKFQVSSARDNSLIFSSHAF